MRIADSPAASLQGQRSLPVRGCCSTRDLHLEAAALPFFDANCFFGRVSRPQPGSFETASDLLAEMDRLGIGEALTYHAEARWHSPDYGNALLLTDIASEPRLHPCWVLTPPETAGKVTSAHLVETMIQRGVRAVRVFPREHRFSISEWCLGPLAAALEAAGAPLFVDFGRRHWGEDIVPWDEVDGLCQAHPELPVVLVHESFGSLHYLFALMSRHPRLMIETSYFVPHQGLEEVCSRFGAERLLFGTSMPMWDGGAPLGNVVMSTVSAEDKRRIAGDNLRRLLAEAQG